MKILNAINASSIWPFFYVPEKCKIQRTTNFKFITWQQMPSMIRNTKLTFNFNLDRFFAKSLSVIHLPFSLIFCSTSHSRVPASSYLMSIRNETRYWLWKLLLFNEAETFIQPTTRLKREFNTPTAHCNIPDIFISKLMLLAWETMILQEYFLTSSGRSNSHELVSASPLWNHWTVRSWMMSRMLMSGMLQ